MQRPHLPLRGVAAITGPTDKPRKSKVPISSVLGPMKLDALAVADDPGFLDALATERNLPPYLVPALRRLSR